MATRWTPSTFACVARRLFLLFLVRLPALTSRPPPSAQCTQFVKLCRDCQLVGGSLSEAQPPLLEADCQVAYTAEVRAQSRAPGSSQKMNYNDFLTALMKLAIKVYPRSHTGAWRRVRHA